MSSKASTRSAQVSSKEASLTPKEMLMLTTAIGMMEGLPKINYEKLASRMGVSLTKNVKSSFIDLFEKIRDETADSDGGDSDEVAEAPVKKKASTKAVVTKKTPTVKKVSAPKKAITSKKEPATKKAAAPKKPVGKTTAPKKAGAGGPKKLTKKQQDAITAKAAAADSKVIADPKVAANSKGTAKAEDVEGQNEEMKVESAGKLNPFTSMNGPHAAESSKSLYSSVKSPFSKVIASVISHEDDAEKSIKGEITSEKSLVNKSEESTIVDGQLKQFSTSASVSTPAADNELNASLRGIAVQEWLDLKANNSDDPLVAALAAK